MKRAFDNSVVGGFATQSGQISAGLTTTKDHVYYNTNMVNIQREDHTELHGIETQFSQTRVLPIVGKTARAEIALKTADIQTKCLPIFQPQVQINSNPLTSSVDRLIYEVGLSATWRNSLLELPRDGVNLSSLAATGSVVYPPYPSTIYVERDNDVAYWSESTLLNVPNASIQLIDTYNSSETVTLFPTNVTNTSLITLFDYFRGSISNVTNPTIVSSTSAIRNTCLTPVVVPSVKTEISGAVLPVLTDPYGGSLVVFVDSVMGFSIGDRVRLFGVRDLTDSFQPLVNAYATVLNVLESFTFNTQPNSDSSPALVLDYSYIVPSYVSPSFGLSTPTYQSPSFGLVVPQYSSPSYGLTTANFASPSFGLNDQETELTFNITDTAGIWRFQVGMIIQVYGATDQRVNRMYSVIRINGNSQIVVNTNNVNFPVDVSSSTINLVGQQPILTFNVADNSPFTYGTAVRVTGAPDPRVNGDWIVTSTNGTTQFNVDAPYLDFPCPVGPTSITIVGDQPEVIFNLASNAPFAVGNLVNISGSPDPRVNGQFNVIRLQGGTQIVVDNPSLDFPVDVTPTLITIENDTPQLTFNVATNAPFPVGTVINVTGSPDPRINNEFTVVGRNGGTQIVVNAPGLSFPVAVTQTLITIEVGAVSFQDGYVINEKVVDGGHIEFLTDEQEFQPINMYGTPPTSNGTITLILDSSFPSIVPDCGFWRGFINNTDLHPMNAAVELTISSYNAQFTPTQQRTFSQLYNGYYSIVSRTINTITFAPLSKSIGNSSLSLLNVAFRVSLAPNFYTFDTTADVVFDPLTTVNKMNFMRTMGYIPTADLETQKPRYPPTASVPPKTWTQAYTVDWNFSAYRNVTWLTQDTTSNRPRLPLQVQDFGIDNGSSTYYNVYEINKFINDCVNPAIDEVITDQTADVVNFEAYSLDKQLGLCYNAYKRLFLAPASAYVWNRAATYVIGDLAVSGTSSSSFVFMCCRTQPAPDEIPLGPISNKSWVYLGLVPYQDGETTPYALCISQIVTSSSIIMTAGMQIYPGVDPLDASPITLSYRSPQPPMRPTFDALIPLPTFFTVAPEFHYNEQTLLSSVKYDGYGFGTINVIQPGLEQQSIALLDYGRRSWGNQGSNNADEWVTFESNTSFKFLFDNFPSYCTAYEDTLAVLRSGTSFPLISYWVWDSTSSHDPRTDTQFYEISQTSESLSSCMSPVESIVVVSENVPVLEELASPASYLIDSDSTAFYARTDTVSLTNKIIGEIPLWNFAPYNVRSVIRYDANELHFSALLDTKTFKQLEYSLYYRHRITQQLVPLILSNYGSVNIKFVFRPIS